MEAMGDELAALEHVLTEGQLADILTKPLSRGELESFRFQLAMKKVA